MHSWFVLPPLALPTPAARSCKRPKLSSTVGPTFIAIFCVVLFLTVGRVCHTALAVLALLVLLQCSTYTISPCMTWNWTRPVNTKSNVVDNHQLERQFRGHNFGTLVSESAHHHQLIIIRVRPATTGICGVIVELDSSEP